MRLCLFHSSGSFDRENIVVVVEWLAGRKARHNGMFGLPRQVSVSKALSRPSLPLVLKVLKDPVPECCQQHMNDSMTKGLERWCGPQGVMLERNFDAESFFICQKGSFFILWPKFSWLKAKVV